MPAAVIPEKIPVAKPVLEQNAVDDSIDAQNQLAAGEYFHYG